MKFLRQKAVLMGTAALVAGSLQAQPFDDGTKPFSMLAGLYVQQADHRSQADTGLALDVRSRIGLYEPPNGAGQIDWVSRINGNFAFESDQTSRLLQQLSMGPQWSFKQSKGRFWVGAALGFESNGSSSGRQKLAGLNAGWYTPALLGANDAFQVQFQNAEVNPLIDPYRLSWAGSSSPYRRWDAQANYRIPLSTPISQALILGYHHYQQSSPMGGNDPRGRNRFGSVRLDLPQQFYVQYDRGSLPLDTYRGSDNTAWRLGWEYRMN